MSSTETTTAPTAAQLRAVEHASTSGKRRHGQQFDPADLLAAAHVAEFCGTDVRVRVRTEYPGGEVYERTGRVSLTTGWRPAFLLMHRAGAVGSSDVLGPRDQIVAVQRGRVYVPGNRL